MTDPIQIVDVSARDGLQNEKRAVNLSAISKAAYLRMLGEAGLKRIEAGSFVNPKAVPAMANSMEVAEHLRPVEQAFPKIIFSYLVPNLKGLEQAVVANAKEIAVFLAVSEEFSKANINKTVDESFAQIMPVVTQARTEGMRVRGYLSTVFGYSDMAFGPAAVARRARELLDMGCFEVSLGDTTGIAKPEQIEPLIRALEAAGVPLSKIAMHFHDTSGNAIRNVEESYRLGIRIFDASTGGLGGCPYANSPKGNLAMEALVAWGETRGLDLGVDLGKLTQAARFMQDRLNEVQEQMGR